MDNGAFQLLFLGGQVTAVDNQNSQAASANLFLNFVARRPKSLGGQGAGKNKR
jgi:hypothetical protein